jgi:hypothetical protein
VALTLPSLDDRTFAGLVDEARALVPALAPAWTNHNPSDPGITLVELFAWLTEMLVYRVDQVPEAHVRAFLALLNGPDWTPAGPALDDDVRVTIAGIRDRWRAVTPRDWEGLARSEFNDFLADARRTEARCIAAGEDPASDGCEAMRGWWAGARMAPSPEALPSAVPDVARAHCAPRRNLQARAESERQLPAEAHVSLVVVSWREPIRTVGHPDDPGTRALRAALWGWLDERRTLTTRHHVVSPLYVPVRVEVLVARRPDLPDIRPGEDTGSVWSHIREPDLRRTVVDAVRAFLDPVHGGPDGTGWPLGRSVFTSDLYAVLEGLPGIAEVADVLVTSAPPPGEEGCIVAVEAWNDDGERVGLDLADHHLPAYLDDVADVHVAEAFVPVRLAVALALEPGADRAAVLGRARDALRRAFPPFGVAPDQGVEVATAALLAAVRGVAGGTGWAVEMEIDPERRVIDRTGAVVAARFLPGEMADVHAAFAVEGGDA